MKKERYFLDNPKNVKIIIMSFFGVCGILLIIDIFIHKHGHFSWEEKPEFFAVYGLVSSVVLVLAAKYGLRKIVKRKEEYYD